MKTVYLKSASGSVAEVGARLEQAIQEQGYGVLGAIDLKSKMNDKGVDFGPACHIFEVCNPHRAKGVLESDMKIATALPCRIAVYEEDGQVQVATMRPTTILGTFEHPELMQEAREVEQDLEAIIDRAARGTG